MFHKQANESETPSIPLLGVQQISQAEEPQYACMHTSWYRSIQNLWLPLLNSCVACLADSMGPCSYGFLDLSYFYCPSSHILKSSLTSAQCLTMSLFICSHHLLKELFVIMIGLGIYPMSTTKYH